MHVFCSNSYCWCSLQVSDCPLNPLDSKGNYSATSNNIMNNIMLVHWPLMGGLLAYVWYSEEGTG